MSEVTVTGTNLGTPLLELMNCEAIEPGSDPSYQMCKLIYLYHPLGLKMVEWPIRMAQWKDREIAVPNSPEDVVRDKFVDEWRRIGANKIIFNVMRQARIYGVASTAMLADGKAASDVIDPFDLPNLTVSWNVFDPLNTSGSLVLNQNPNAMDFQKHSGIAVQAERYPRSRSVTIMNEEPIYLGYTTSAFGYVGRSVYQRALFPLKSFINTMSVDDMIARKAGLLIMKLKPAGSIVNNIMTAMTAAKRSLLQQGQTNNVLSVTIEEAVETLNMQNIDGAYGMARNNIIENIASADDMPAMILKAETFAEGFGEGSEDAKYVAKYIDRKREDMHPLYDYFDNIVKHRAWNETFYTEVIQKKYPEYEGVEYKNAFYAWDKSFSAKWPNLLSEPDSERAEAEKVKYECVIGVLEAMMPTLSPSNKARVLEWAADNLNTNKIMFPNPLELDYEENADWQEEQAQNMMAGAQGENEGEEPNPPRIGFKDAQHPLPRLAPTRQRA